MKFKVKTEDLTNALNMVSVVTPKPITAKDGPVYLFSVRNDKCFVYSRDQFRVARASFPVTDVEGTGSFLYPSAYTDSFKFAGDHLDFETVDGPDDWSVKYKGSSGVEGERATFDPRMTSSCDKDLDNAVGGSKFPSAILREAISMSRPFLAKPVDAKAEENYKTLQVFDKSNPLWERGDGHMFCSDSISAYYFYCSVFEGKSLEIHSEHLPVLLNFLAKCGGDISVKKGTNFTFVEDDEGTAIGWTHHVKTHGKFAYYALSKDNYVLSVDKSLLQKALRFTRTELEAKRDKIKVLFNSSQDTLQFSVLDGGSKATSFPVVTTVKSKLERDLSFNVNIDKFIDIIDSVKGNMVELRILIVPPGDNRKNEVFFIRTIDEFRVDSNGKVSLDTEKSFPCRVTRYTPSKE